MTQVCQTEAIVINLSPELFGKMKWTRTLLLFVFLICSSNAHNLLSNFWNSPFSIPINNLEKRMDSNLQTLIHKKYYKLILEYGIRAPDNFHQEIILINGTFPGPTITAFQHEELVVEIVNKLDHGITMHFHGLLQMKTIESDGTPGVVQCPIPPNCSHVYKMRTEDQVGTYMYHTHTGLDLVWAHGALIIKDNPLTWAEYPKPYFYHYGKDNVIFLQQIFHSPLSNFYDSLVKGPFLAIPETASLLINGKSFGLWKQSNGEPFTSGYEVINVKPGYIYRFRVINMAIETMLWFTIHNHTMKVIEMDGILCSPVVTDHLEIDSAQRYSVLVHTNRPVDNYLIETRIISSTVSETKGPRNGIAILHYKGADDPEPLRRIPRPGTLENMQTSQWILPKLHPNLEIEQLGVYPIPTKIDRSIIITSRLVLQFFLIPRFSINGNIANAGFPKVPYLSLVREGINITKEPEVFEISVGQSIQFVLQNHVNFLGLCMQHPWHFHGHSFYVVGEGPDGFDPVKGQSVIDNNIERGNLQFRDVVTLFADQVIQNTTQGAECGWVAIRFLVNNPGLWLVHCHITAHSIIGKRFVLWEHTEANPMLLNE